MLRRLRMSDFRVYGDQEIPLGNGVTTIVGPNGSGKTTILEAIEFALFKRVKRKEKDVRSVRELIRHGRRRASVELMFESPVNGRVYTVRRDIFPNKTTAELHEQGKESATLVRVRDVDNEIVELLGMDRDTFAALTYVRQGDIDLLSRLAPSKKRQTLRNMMGLGQYEDLTRGVKKLIKEIEETKREIGEHRERLGDMLSRLPTTDEIAAAREAVESVAASVASDKLEPIRSVLDRLYGTVTELNNEISSPELKQREREADQQEAIATDLRRILGQIPEVAEQQIKPLIQTEARNIFLEIFGDRYSDLELTDEYDVRLYDIRGNPVSLSNASGGEDVCVNFSLRVAVNSALQRIAADGERGILRPLGLLIMDEPGMGLDSQRRRWLPEAISGLQSIRQVIVVTHMEELKSAADTVITLEPQGKDRPPRVTVET